MKIINTLIICLAATLATSKAQVIYDNFTGPAGPLNTSPSASLWTVQASPADTARLDGSGNLLQTGGNGSDIRSTTSFNMTEVAGMQFKSDVYGFFFGGAAMVYGGSSRGLYLRNDLGGFRLQLWVLDANGAHSGDSFTPATTGALWTLSYNPATSTASAYQNGSLVSSLSGITITDTTAQFYIFQYGPSYANVNTSYQYVATTLPVYWAPSAGGGGTGTWSAANTNWASIAGIQGDRVQSSTGTLVFGNTSGTVTVTTNVNVAAGMTFSTDAYTLTNGTVTLTGANAASNTITTAASVGATVSSQLAGANGMTKAGTGTLTFGGSATNTLTGTTTVSAGTLQLNKSASNAAIAGNVAVATGATLLISQSEQVNDASAVTLSGGTIKLAGSASETFGNLTVSSDSILDFGNLSGVNMSFGTYTPTAKITVNNFIGLSTLVFKSDMTDFINDPSRFSFANGFSSAIWNSGSSTFTITAIPEPSTVLAALGLAGLMLWPARRRLFSQADGRRKS